MRRAQGDPEAFGLLFDKYYQPIFGYLLRRTAHLELAQDLTSETFFKALKNLKRYRWQNVPFSAWLYRIATNEMSSHFRRHKRGRQIGLDNLPELSAEKRLDEEVIRAEEALSAKQDFIKLQKLVVKLKPIYQSVITLRFFEKKKISEISHILGRPEGTVKAQLHRALKELRELMASSKQPFLKDDV